MIGAYITERVCGGVLERGLCVILPNITLSDRTGYHTFVKTRGYQLCQYDVILTQLVATCLNNFFYRWTQWAHNKRR
jgi:hypothetical protein